MIPGRSRNCRRTSKTTAPADRDTALIASPEKRKTTAAPAMSPTRLLGCEMSIIRLIGAPSPLSFSPTSAAPVVMASRYDPNRAAAARTAVAMAMPLVMALVVLPTASRSLITARPIWSSSASSSSAASPEVFIPGTARASSPTSMSNCFSSRSAPP
ncbi:hypothetical protein SVIOM342S_05149 [Streptomyces violaceorubidus]